MKTAVASATLDRASLDAIREKCALRDRLYSRDFYNGQNFYTVLEPLLASIQIDGGVPKAIGEQGNSLPETTASCLLALYRMKLLDQATIRRMQNYILGTQVEVAQFLKSGFNSGQYSPNWEQCAWSASDGRNVWSTVNSLWALFATQYDGSFLASVLAATLWLVRQQAYDGGWCLAKSEQNPSNIFLTSNVLYVLTLAKNLGAWSDAERREIQKGIDGGVEHLLRRQYRGKGYWAYNPNDPDDQTIEPTSSAMALWALHHCIGKDSKSLIKRGVEHLRRSLRGKPIWDDRTIVDGIVPESNSQKTLQGYTPALPLALLQIGVPPTDPMIIKAITFLAKERKTDGWLFGSTSPPIRPQVAYAKRTSLYYVGTGEALTFTTAFALWTIDTWHRRWIKSGILICDIGKPNPRSRKLQYPKMTRVAQRHLAVFLTLAGAALVFAYFWILSLLFQQTITDVFRSLKFSDVSDILDSIVKILIVPAGIYTLLANFYYNGTFSFQILKDFWHRLVG